MSEKRASLEVIAPSVEEAVAKGLADLGLSEDAVEVEVLDAGSRGLFGLGSRQARVRLTIKAPVDMSIGAAPAEVIEDVKQDEPVDVVVKEPEPVEDQAADVVVYADISVQGDGSQLEGEDDDSRSAALKVARDTVAELLQKMQIMAEVTAHFVESEDGRGRPTLFVEVHGDDLSILIGPRAETLNALQYIASLIIGKELGRSVPLVVDVESYRQRRAQQIRQLARRMAEQAVRTGRRQVLEPMPANERRLIHIELRNHPQVTTESIGEEPRRKVTISPKA